MKLTVIFDGQCGVCTRTIRLLHERDTRGVLTFCPCQSVSEAGWQGVTRQQCERSVWVICEDGTIAAGSDAAALIASALVQNWWPWRIARLPGVRQILQAGYRLVANNRRRLPGDTPWCQQHPELCDEDSVRDNGRE